MQVLNTKFHENPSKGSRADICRRTDGHYKLRDTFRDYAMGLKRAALLIVIEIRRL